ncbi:uncharacterized protein [Nicotiana sylvestris]|uniref:uncharacterized protein n=1 Tax=Nicotiana sylvestris TaxID=4096 RepID=UPI00388C4022
MLDRLAGHVFYYFLDGYSDYNKILIALEDQEKTTFTCMMAIFTDMVEYYLEVFMDDFLVVGISSDYCLANLDKVLARYKETILVFNWEKYYFMVEEGIVLRQKISKNGIELDKAKIEDFSKVVNPLCKLLEKDAKFHFNDDFMRAFELQKLKLTTTPIITTPN